MKKYIIPVILITLIVFTLIIVSTSSKLVIDVYNYIVIKNQDAIQSFSKLDAIFQKRHALVNNLLKITKETKSFEKDLIKNEKDILLGTALAKASATKMDVMLPESIKNKLKSEDGLGNLLTNAMDKLMVNAQHYPQINDPKITNRDATFNSLNKLRSDLMELENEILVQKQDINDKVKEYNSSISLFPGNLVANYFEFGIMNYIKAINSYEKQDVEINF